MALSSNDKGSCARTNANILRFQIGPDYSPERPREQGRILDRE
jgi:hypothetical protein